MYSPSCSDTAMGKSLQVLSSTDQTVQRRRLWHKHMDPAKRQLRDRAQQLENAPSSCSGLAFFGRASKPRT